MNVIKIQWNVYSVSECNAWNVYFLQNIMHGTCPSYKMELQSVSNMYTSNKYTLNKVWNVYAFTQCMEQVNLVQT